MQVKLTKSSFRKNTCIKSEVFIIKTFSLYITSTSLGGEQRVSSEVIVVYCLN